MIDTARRSAIRDLVVHGLQAHGMRTDAATVERAVRRFVRLVVVDESGIDKRTERAVRELLPLIPKRDGDALVRAVLADGLPRSDKFRAWAADALAGRIKRKAGQGRPRGGSLNPIEARAAISSVQAELSRGRYRKRKPTSKGALAYIENRSVRVAGRLWTAAQWDRALRPREAWVRALPGIKRKARRKARSEELTFAEREAAFTRKQPHREARKFLVPG